MVRMRASRLALPFVVFAFGCSHGTATTTGGGGTTTSTSAAGTTSSGKTSSATTSGTSNTTGTGQTGTGTGTGGGGPGTDTLDSNRDRLLKTYFDFLKANATQPQSNGLSSSNVSSVCDVWTKLDPSSQTVFLTLTRRLQGSIISMDGSSMLWHVLKIYRITGGQGATATDPGTCGGGEYNRMIMSMDAELQAVQLAANNDKGAMLANGKYDIADAPTQGTFWRDSHDLGGPHAPFDLSDEADQGAPRGQTQYFKDPSSAVANAPLGRQDLMTLVDPLGLEMDQDYDCVHNSNPLCSYITYGPACFPETSMVGAALFASRYGDYEPNWKPTGCP